MKNYYDIYGSMGRGRRMGSISDDISKAWAAEVAKLPGEAQAAAQQAAQQQIAQFIPGQPAPMVPTVITTATPAASSTWMLYLGLGVAALFAFGLFMSKKKA